MSNPGLQQSEKREGITDFKNKNLQNNMRGLLGGGKADESSSEDEANQ